MTPAEKCLYRARAVLGLKRVEKETYFKIHIKTDNLPKGSDENRK